MEELYSLSLKIFPMKKLPRYLFPILAILFGLFLIYIIYSAGTRTPNIFLSAIGKIPFGDKIGHFLLMGTMSFILNLALKIKEIKIRTFNLLLGSCIITVLITIEEFSQIFIQSRNFDLIDLLFNYLGIITFGYFAKWVGNRIWKNG